MNRQTDERTRSKRILGGILMVLGLLVAGVGLVGSLYSERPGLLADPLFYTIMAVGIAIEFVGFRVRRGEWPGRSGDEPDLPR